MTTKTQNPNPAGMTGNVSEISGLSDIRTTKFMIVYESEFDFSTNPKIRLNQKVRCVKIFGDDVLLGDIEAFEQMVAEKEGRIIYKNFIDGLFQGAL